MLKRLLKYSAVASLVMSCCTSSLPAGEFEPSHIDGDASWFAHLNFEAGTNSKIMGQFTDESQDGKASRISDWLARRYGIEAEELDGLTIYSLGDETEHAVSLLYGNIVEEKLLDVVRRNATVDEDQFNGQTVYTWSLRSKADASNQSEGQSSQVAQLSRSSREQAGDENRGENSVSAVFLDDVTVFANDAKFAQQAVNAITNEKSLSVKKDTRLQQQVPGEILIQAVVLNVQEASKSLGGQGQQGDAWTVMSELDSLSVAIGEMDKTNAFVAVEAKANSEQAAQHVGDVLDGLRALAALSNTDDSDFNLDSLKPDIQQSGAFLRIGWTLDISELSSMLSRQLENAQSELSEVSEQLSSEGQSSTNATRTAATTSSSK